MADVSIIIPTKNRPDTLMRAVQSVLKQTLTNWELFIINDGNGALEIDVNDSRIHLFENARQSGANGARNTGIFKTNGKYIAFLDDDDEWTAEKLELQYKIMTKTKATLSFTGRTIIRKAGNVNSKRLVFRDRIFSQRFSLFFHNYIGTTSTIMVNADHIKLINGFDENLNSIQDYDLYLRLSKLGKIVGIKASLLNYYLDTEQDHVSINLKFYMVAAYQVWIKQKGIGLILQPIGLLIILFQKIFQPIRD
jgi:glycosyltransferase involved in cell wall biosynthesis